MNLNGKANKFCCEFSEMKILYAIKPTNTFRIINQFRSFFKKKLRLCAQTQSKEPNPIHIPIQTPSLLSRKRVKNCKRYIHYLAKVSSFSKEFQFLSLSGLTQILTSFTAQIACGMLLLIYHMTYLRKLQGRISTDQPDQKSTKI